MRLWLVVLLLLLSRAVAGQSLNAFNSNMYNGLPSNRVYHIITDRYGYLWIATDKGVVKYNGYDFHHFDIADGLPTSDIWEMFEDKKGRIWLGCFSDNIGYIYNNKFHKAWNKNYAEGFYPGIFNDFEDGIIFFSRVISRLGICIEHNDTITNYPIDSTLFTKGETPDLSQQTLCINSFNSNYKPGVVVCGAVVYAVVVTNGRPHLKRLFRIPSNFWNALITGLPQVYGNKMYCYENAGHPVLTVVDLVDSSLICTDLSPQGITGKIRFVYSDIRELCNYIITDSGVFKYSYADSLQFRQSYTLASFSDNGTLSGNTIRPIYKDAFWGLCAGTTDQGLWRQYEGIDHFIPATNLRLADFSFTGNVGGENYWWNNASKTLAWGTDPARMNYRVYKDIIDAAKLRCVTSYNKDTLLFTGNYSHFLIKSTGQLVPNKLYGGFLSIPAARQDVYTVTMSGFSVGNYITDSGFRLRTLSRGRYTGLCFDSLRNNYWAYNLDKIYIYNAPMAKGTLISNSDFSKLGIHNKIEKIAIDNLYGNIFLKGADNISVYYPEKKSYLNAFSSYNLKEAAIFLHKNILIIVGEFGILFSKINGPLQLSRPLVYHNIRGIKYQYIYDCQVTDHEILIKTDKDSYIIPMPAQSEIEGAQPDSTQYKLILTYKNNATVIRPGDTIDISQNDLRLQFDVINPTGNGKIKYNIKLFARGKTSEVNVNELTLPALAADEYYLLTIVVSDDAWRSSEIKMHLYIHPHWYQTRTGKQIVWLSVVVLIIASFAVAVIITRKIVLKASERRHMQMELELKAIYSQLNPHFIFNSLNAAMFLVQSKRFETAYQHIYKFSSLLRSYIKSSRDRFISIDEEIRNLKNYIELQQERFNNNFEYSIDVAPEVNTGLSIPSLLIQPVVENAIIHGLQNKNAGRYLEVKFIVGTDGDTIICSVDDNGVGRKQSVIAEENQNSKRESYGSLLISDLVDIMNKSGKVTVQIEYIDKVPPLTGTTVILKIKNLKNGALHLHNNRR